MTHLILSTISQTDRVNRSTLINYSNNFNSFFPTDELIYNEHSRVFKCFTVRSLEFEVTGKLAK